jgi:magnesium transporter
MYDDKIITVCQRSSETLDFFTGGAKTLDLSNKISFVLQILGRAAFVFLKHLKELNRNANTIERELQKSVKNNELIQLLSIQKSLVFFTTSIKTNELLLEKLQKSALLRDKDAEQELAEDVMTENVQALEMADTYSSILTGTMDAFASVISNNLNIVMKRLAIVNIVLMIPTLIYSFYGMNIDLPFANAPWATVGVMAASVLAAAVGVILLNVQRKHRIPRLGTYPHHL